MKHKVCLTMYLFVVSNRPTLGMAIASSNMMSKDHHLGGNSMRKLLRTALHEVGIKNKPALKPLKPVHSLLVLERLPSLPKKHLQKLSSSRQGGNNEEMQH